jgi:hypothetical protein
MAPEQATDARSADTRSDIYGLGCTLYCLLAGEPPFQGHSAHAVLLAQQSAAVRPLRSLRPEVPAALQAVVARMMARDPAERFQQPREVAEALVPFIKPPSQSIVESPPAERAPVAPERPLRPSPSGRRTVALVALLASALTLSALLVPGAALIRARLAEGTVVVENVPDDAEVEVDGSKVTVRRHGESVTVTVTSAGTHELRVTQRGVEILASDVVVKVGGEPIRLRAERTEASRPTPGVAGKVADGSSKAAPVEHVEAPDPPLARLRQRLNGKIRFNDGILTLEYDFTNPEQLKDFDASDASPVVAEGKLRLAFADVLRHVVPFKTLALKTTIGMRNRGRTHLRVTGGASISTLDYNAWHADLNFEGKRLRGEFDSDYAHPPDVSRMLPLEYWSKEREIGFRFGSVRLHSASESAHAGQVELLGGDGGNDFGALTLSGEPDARWLASFTDPAAAPAALPSGPPKTVPAEPAAVNLDQLKPKFAVPVTWNDGTLTLHYDFRDAGQLRDFRWEEDRPATAGSYLRLKKGQAVEHKVRFRTVTVAGEVSVGDPVGTHLKTTGGFEVKGGTYQAWYIDLNIPPDVKARALYDPPSFNLATPFELRISARRHSLRWYGTLVGSSGTGTPAGNVILAGGQGGNHFGNLTLSGEPDPDWLASCLED